jgi:hypothetical protein
MSASFGDVFSWLMPLLIGGIVSLCGLLTLLLGRFDPGSGWEVRGLVAVLLGILALPVLPLAFVINPSLSQRTAWAAETEQWKQRSLERLERQNVIAARKREIDRKLAELDREKTGKPGDFLRQWPQRQKLQRESLELSNEKLALTQEENQDSDRLGSVGRGRPRDPMPYLLPLGWGGTLYALGWLLGRKKSAAEETTEPAPAGLPTAPEPTHPEKPAEPPAAANRPRE